jgi:hypothetical protein
MIDTCRPCPTHPLHPLHPLHHPPTPCTPTRLTLALGCRTRTGPDAHTSLEARLAASERLGIDSATRVKVRGRKDARVC